MKTKYLLLGFMVIAGFYSSSKIFIQNYKFMLAHISMAYPFLMGVILFGLLLTLKGTTSLSANWLTYFNTKVHENCHQLIAMIWGKKIFEFHVRTDGTGDLVIEKNLGDVSMVMICLAPYWCSYLSFSCCLIKFFFGQNEIFIIDVLTGFLWMLHQYFFFMDTRLYQSDIQRVGKLYSVIFIVCMHIITLNMYAFFIFAEEYIKYR